MVTGMGEMVMRMYNLKGEEVGTRNGMSATTVGAHYSNTDEEGVYVVKNVPAEGDWLLMSLCSAHLEEKHQWGPGIGLEDDIFITNEEWIHYAVNTNFTGISVRRSCLFLSCTRANEYTHLTRFQLFRHMLWIFMPRVYTRLVRSVLAALRKSSSSIQ